MAGEGGKEGGKEGWKEGGTEGGKERGSEGAPGKGGRQGRREGAKGVRERKEGERDARKWGSDHLRHFPLKIQYYRLHSKKNAPAAHETEAFPHK